MTRPVSPMPLSHLNNPFCRALEKNDSAQNCKNTAYDTNRYDATNTNLEAIRFDSAQSHAQEVVGNILYRKIITFPRTNE
jgi:hypothetical protein